MRKIVHVITGLTAGGAEMVLYRLAARLDPLLYESLVVSLTGEGIYGAPIAALGVPVICLGMANGRPSIAGLARLVKLLRAHRPAVVQGWMYHGNLAATLAAATARLRAPVLWNVRASIHAGAGGKRSTEMVIRGGARLSRRTSGIIYNSSVSAAQHEAIGYAAERTEVIPNGFDCTEFRPDAVVRRAVREELGVDDEHVLVGCFGRDHPMKDHAAFVQAASLAVARNPRLRFVIAGEHMDAGNTRMVAMLREHGLASHLQLLGERTDMPRLNAALDIACLSSAWGEGFPNVLGEAMATGVPCVTTDTGESGVIVGATGRVVAPRDVAALADALVELGGDAALRASLGHAARERILDAYSIDAVTAAYGRYYSRWT